MANRAYPPGTLERLQDAEREIVAVIDRICREQGLTYFIEAGTLLGAVRHGGFIPWDDDIDIGMPYEDYLKFMELAPKLLPEGYSYHDSTNTPGFPELWIKIFRDGTRFMDEMHVVTGCEQAIFVDVFPYVCLSADHVDAVRRRRRATFWQKMSYLHFLAEPKIPKKTSFRALKVLGCKVIHYTVAQLFSPSYILAHFIRACEGPTDGGIWINASYEYSDFLKDQDMFPVRDIDFDGMNLCAPRNPDAYLKACFGDYMALPPEDERYTHLPVVLDFGDGVNVMDGWR